MATPSSPASSLAPPARFVAPANWRAIDLLSDLHLGEATPRTFDAWAAHLRHTRADAVFILGDLFEVWVGDDMAEHGFEARCVEVLREAAAAKTIAFMPGNRDFLVGDAMLRASGVQRFEDPTLVEAFGRRVLLSHGDALCLDDTGYQRYRAVVRRPSLRRVFMALPLTLRRAIGRAMRRRSEATRVAGRAPRFDVDPAAAAALLQVATAPTLIHGHTHAPASHALGAGLVRHVLSDWDLDSKDAARAEVLRWDAGGFARLAPEAATTGRP